MSFAVRGASATQRAIRRGGAEPELGGGFGHRKVLLALQALDPVPLPPVRDRSRAARPARCAAELGDDRGVCGVNRAEHYAQDALEPRRVDLIAFGHGLLF